VTDGRGRPTDGHGLAGWLSAVAPRSAAGEIAIALVSDADIRRLNRLYRRKDSVTDVLSFPAARGFQAPRTQLRALGPEPQARTSSLGDVAIAVGVARRQARAAGHAYATELKVLALHGLLHLLGYDHHDAADGGRMARVERALRRKGGLRAGLIERAEE
jgi:probable rRNA maturation factor